MFEKKLSGFDELPVRQSHRRCTDIFCTLVSSIFSISLFIIALCVFNKQNFYMTNFPTDSDNTTCGIGVNKGYSYVYLPDINQIDKRVCVSTCPTQKSLTLLCRPNNLVRNCYSLYMYPTKASDDRLGGFCLPINQQEQKIFSQNLALQKKWGFLKIYDILKIGLLISIGIGVIYLLIVQFIPRIASGLMYCFAGIICIFIAFLAIFTAEQWKDIGGIRIIIAILFICLGFYILLNLCFYKKRIKVSGVFLSYSSTYLKHHLQKIMWILLFLGFTFGLIVLSLFQYLAYTSFSKPIPSQDDIYLHCKANPVLTILCVIQFIWGLQFLKDSFNFIISGNASQWYVRQGKMNSLARNSRYRSHRQNCCIPIARLMCMNWGSVVGGSFLNAFITPFNYIFQIFRCYPDGVCPSFSNNCNSCSSFCCKHMCDLVRTDAYTYINLTGIPYCNASRNCQALIQNSNLFIGGQSVTYLYRSCSYIFCVGISSIIGYFMVNGIKNGSIEYQNIYHPQIGTIILMIMLSYCVCCYFTDLHTNISQALQISFLVENKFSNPENKFENISEMKDQLLNLQRNQKDGTF